MTISTRALPIGLLCLSLSTLAHAAQDPPKPAAVTPTATGAVAAAPVDADDDDDAVLDPAEPDFTIINIPTTLALPKHKSDFRLTHRFAGNLRSGSFGEQAGSLFGLDDGAIIGIEYRYAPVRHLEATFYRSSFDRTIQFYGKYDAVRRKGSPVAVSALVSIEGSNNFRDKYEPAVGLVVSGRVGTRLGVYATPIWVGNTEASLDELTPNADGSISRHNTFFVGLGARVRAFGTTYLVAELAPRITGYAPDQQEYGFGIEKRVGGHMFSLTFTNTFGTTFAQVARGGVANSLYLGFNLGRKFY